MVKGHATLTRGSKRLVELNGKTVAHGIAFTIFWVAQGKPSHGALRIYVVSQVLQLKPLKKKAFQVTSVLL